MSALRLGVLSALLVAGCGFLPEPPRPDRSVIVRGPDRLRTFTVVREIDGAPLLCAAFGVLPAVEGILRGDPASINEPVWLEGDDERRLSIVWPEGFTLRFEPLAVLRDERNLVVAREGDSVVLGQVAQGEAAGTTDDPYIASGIVFDGCYPFRP